jgi:predicted DNA-binding transcriptional regulator YafY
MSLSATLHSYFTIIEKLQSNNASYPTKEELIAHVENSLESFRDKKGKAEKGISVRTFIRDKKEIYNLFGIDIQFSKKHKGYFLVESGIKDRFLQQMAQSFEALQLLNLSTHLQGIIQPEKQKHKGIEHFGEILYAIQERRQLQFTYHKFWDEKPTERTVAPYHLKEAGQRWYLIAKDEGGNQYIKHFALDRMSNVVQTTTAFTPPTHQSYLDIYQYTFGIDGPHSNAEKVQEIILSFDHYQGKYVKALPLHHSQEILVDNDDELRISLRLYITRDLVMQILSHGEKVKVIEPKSLANSLATEFRTTLSYYQNV